MKRFIKYKIIGLALLMAGFAACDTADQDVSPVTSPDSYPKATFTTNFTGSTINEGDTLVYKVTTDKPQDRAITFTARIKSGTLTDDDIEVTAGVLAAYTTETEIKVVFLKDWDTADETAQIEFGAFTLSDRYQPNRATVNPVIDLTVKNYVSDDLIVTLDWSQKFSVQEIKSVKVNVGTYYTYLDDTVKTVYDLGSEVDYDFYISDAATFDISDPYSSEIGNYTAATGDSPEVMTISGLADGDYVIWSDLYRNYVPEDGFYSLADSTQKITVAANFIRQGTALDLTVAENESQAPLIYKAGYAPAKKSFVFGVIAYITAANGKYTIKDYDGVASGPWKGVLKTPRPDAVERTK